MTVIPETEDLAARLRARRSAAWGEFKTIADAAAGARRPLTGPEQDRSDDLESEMAKLDQRLRSVLDTDVFFDAGNSLLSQVTCQLHTGAIREQGQEPRGVVTIRTASTTVTVVLLTRDLGEWIGILSGLRDSLAAAQEPPDGPAIPDRRTAVRPGLTGLDQVSQAG